MTQAQFDHLALKVWSRMQSDAYKDHHAVEFARRLREEWVKDLETPQDYIELLREAEAIVKSKSVYKRFIDGTPLANDIPVWMADFVLETK